MIHLSDSLILAATKLKTRRLRLLVAVVVSGLIFIALVVTSLLFNGVNGSIQEFSSDGMGQRYVMDVRDAASKDLYTLLAEPEVIERAKKLDKEYIARRQAEAKRLGVTYDPAVERLSVMSDKAAAANGTTPTVEPTPQTKDMIDEILTQQSAPFFEQLEVARQQYAAKAVYHSVSLSGFLSSDGEANAWAMTMIKDNTEQKLDPSGMVQPTGVASITSAFTAMSDGLLESFLLEGQSFAKSSQNDIPVIAPYSAAEELLGLKKLPVTATSKQRLDRLKEVRQRAAGVTFEVCLRNQASQSRQQQAEDLAKQIEQNKAKKDYIKPEFITEKSSKPCLDTIVSRDVRTAATKRETEKQEKFDQLFGAKSAAQRKAQFRIVGLVADLTDPGQGFSVGNILSAILSSNLGQFGWYMPLSSQELLPEFDGRFAKVGKHTSYDQGVFLELADANSARRFTKEKTCASDLAMGSDAGEKCAAAGTPFYINPFGSNSLATEELHRGFQSVYAKATLVFAALSAIIMMGTVGKVIADSRRETAVFRAIGAKRSDIAQIYLLYVFLVGVVVVIFAFTIGFAIVAWIQSKYASDLTVDALTIYNSTNLNRKFILMGVDSTQLTMLAATIVGAALLSAVLPLLSNVRRSPIKDMRDER